MRARTPMLALIGICLSSTVSTLRVVPNESKVPSELHVPGAARESVARLDSNDTAPVAAEPRAMHSLIEKVAVAIEHSIAGQEVGLAFALGTLIVVLLLSCFIFLVMKQGFLSKDFMDQEEEDEDADTLALRLRRSVRKYPVTTGTMQKLAGAKSRYIVIEPSEGCRSSWANGKKPQMGKCDSEVDTTTKWANGTMAWWEDEAAFSRGDDSKGDINLKTVVSAEGGANEKYGFCEVEVSYIEKVDDKRDVKKLIFLLRSEHDAAKWTNGFNKFLTQVRPSPLKSKTVSGSPLRGFTPSGSGGSWGRTNNSFMKKAAETAQSSDEEDSD